MTHVSQLSSLLTAVRGELEMVVMLTALQCSCSDWLTFIGELPRLTWSRRLTCIPAEVRLKMRSTTGRVITIRIMAV